MKATLTLKNGTLVNFECHPQELSAVLSGFDNVSKAVREDITNVKTPSVKNQEEKRSYTKRGSKPVRKQTPWTERDIIEIGKIISENLYLDTGLTPKVKKYIRTLSDVRNRTDATLASITSEIKLYLRTGDNNRTNGKIRSVLNSHGIFPVAKFPVSRPSYLNLEEA